MTASEKPVKICFIAPKAYPLFNQEVRQTFGGAELDLYFLATELAQDPQFDVSFVVADYGQPATEERQGVRLIKGPDFTSGAWAGGRQTWAALRTADADVYMIKTASPGVPLLAWFCRKYRRAFVYRTSHRYEVDGTYSRRHPVWGRAFAWALRRADKVYAQNEDDAELLRRTMGVSSQVAPNGHRLSDWTDEERDVVLWVGRTADFKQPERFLELARRRPKQRFTMVCQPATGDTRYDEFVAQAKELDNLEFIPRVPFDKIEGYFAQAIMLVCTSDSEGFPNTFIQACNCGTPILSLAVNPDGLLDKHQCGLCAEGDEDRFMTLFDQLLEPATARRYGTHARRYAEEHHDIRKIVREYKTTFVELAAQRREGT